MKKFWTADEIEFLEELLQRNESAFMRYTDLVLGGYRHYDDLRPSPGEITAMVDRRALKDWILRKRAELAAREKVSTK